MTSEQRLWVEKYRPMKFDQATTMHNDQIDMLSKLAKSDDFPHILLYGPSGSGKRSLTKCLLQELYQTNAVHKIKSELKEFKAGASGSTSVECIVFSSNYHIEVTPCEADNHDKVIIQKLIKEIAGSQQLDQKQQKTFKVIVIHEIDNLTKQAQAALRRTMETYMPFCRIIANCESLSKVIQPVRSRCLQVRVPAPQEQQIIHVLRTISSAEHFDLPPELAITICRQSRRNLRRAIMMLQTVKLKNNNLTPKSYVPCPEYESYTREIAKDVISEQSPKQLRQIRSKLYDLLTKGITADMIFQVLTREFLKPAQGGQKMGGGIPEFIKPEVLRYAVLFDHRCKDGAKAIIHLEAFLARVMCLYKGAMQNGSNSRANRY